MPTAMLSPHFTLEEFLHSDTADAQGIANTPTPDVVGNLMALATLMEAVRARCGGNAVVISSGYRCPELNAAVGGASNSAHLYGCACDFTIPGYGSPHDVWCALQPLAAALGIDQLIDETSGGAAWVHIGRAIPPGAPRGECFAL